MLTWFLSTGRIFVHTTSDKVAKAILGLTVVLILVDVSTKLYRGLGGASTTPRFSQSESVAS